MFAENDHTIRLYTPNISTHSQKFQKQFIMHCPKNGAAKNGATRGATRSPKIRRSKKIKEKKLELTGRRISLQKGKLF